MSTSAVIPVDHITELDRIADESNIVALQGQGSFASAIAMAAAIKRIKESITPEILAPIMELQGTALGFRTDKDSSGGYKADVIKEVFVEATLRGFKMVGNQVNVIAGRFYATKEGFEARFRELSKRGLITDMKLHPSVPRTTADGAIVTYSATWKWQGKADSIDALEIPVKVNGGMGADAILGKAKRKILAAIYSRVTGSEISDGDAGEPPINIEATTVKTADAPAAKLAPDVLGNLEDLLKPIEDKANAFLLHSGSIKAGQTFRDVSDKLARSIIKRPADFFQAAGAKQD